MNANIDQEMCTGCGTCKKTCSDVFQMNNGKAMIIASCIPRDLESICWRTMNTCPSGAIRIGEAKGIMLTGSGFQKRAWVAL